MSRASDKRFQSRKFSASVARYAQSALTERPLTPVDVSEPGSRKVHAGRYIGDRAGLSVRAARWNARHSDPVLASAQADAREARGEGAQAQRDTYRAQARAGIARLRAAGFQRLIDDVGAAWDGWRPVACVAWAHGSAPWERQTAAEIEAAETLRATAAELAAVERTEATAETERLATLSRAVLATLTERPATPVVARVSSAVSAGGYNDVGPLEGATVVVVRDRPIVAHTAATGPAMSALQARPEGAEEFGRLPQRRRVA